MQHHPGFFECGNGFCKAIAYYDRTGADSGAFRPQGFNARKAALAGRYQVFDEYDVPPIDVSAFHHLFCAVILGLFPDEDRRLIEIESEGGAMGNARSLNAGNDVILYGI